MATLNKKFKGRGFEDESIKAGQGGDFMPRYRSEENRKDRMRFMPLKGTPVPIEIQMHKGQGAKGIAYIPCSMTSDCPACELGLETPVVRWAVPIILISTRTLDKNARKWKLEPVGEVQRWVFGKDKYTQIRDIVLPEFDKKSDLYRTDLEVVCQDTQFQRVAISVTSDKSKLTRDAVTDWKETGRDQFIDWLNDEFSPEGVQAAMDRVLVPASRGKKAGKSRKAKDEKFEVEADEDDFEDELDDLVDGLDD